MDKNTVDKLIEFSEYYKRKMYSKQVFLIGILEILLAI
jgi:hypothetical protein